MKLNWITARDMQKGGNGQWRKLTSLMRRACSMTSVRPLSCREESREGSWNTNTVTTSVAINQKDRQETFKKRDYNPKQCQQWHVKTFNSLLQLTPSLIWLCISRVKWEHFLTAESEEQLKSFSEALRWTHLRGTVKGHNTLHYWWCAWVR